MPQALSWFVAKGYHGNVIAKGEGSMQYLAAVASLLLLGCATPPPEPYDSKYFTFRHGTARFDSAMEYARSYCAQAKLKARHLGTDSPPGSMSLSRFECVPD